MHRVLKPVSGPHHIPPAGDKCRPCDASVCALNWKIILLNLQALAGQVCEKVEEKARTTYNEVADELVAEFSNVDAAGELGEP